MNAKILNVDDHEAGRYARSRYLTRAGFTVLEAGLGNEALTLVRSEKPQLVLLDINLPDINGLEVCRLIKSDPETARMPVIFLSASRLADLDVVVGLETGADNYLREPVEPTVLIATVRSLLRAREAEEALVRSNEQLRRFAYVVSHELQEPLRMVKSYSQLVASKYRGKLDSDADEFIEYTVQGVTRMETFIRDMLAYSQVAEGGLDLKPTSLQKVLEWALMEVQAAVGESGATITHDSLPTVVCDGMRLSTVFKNLVGNAIKYRGEQAPRVHVSALEQDDRWKISVTDNGIGIDPRYTNSVFTLFKRLHGRERAGSGVGLAICKEIVEHHGGDIWVESELNKGSTFVFTLPKMTAERAATGQAVS